MGIRTAKTDDYAPGSSFRIPGRAMRKEEPGGGIAMTPP